MGLVGSECGSERGGQADDTTCDACAGISSFERFFVASLAEVVDFAVADARSSDDRVLSTELNLSIFKEVLGNTVLASFNIAEVADVTDFTDWSSVRLAVWVIVGAGCLAALNQVA